MKNLAIALILEKNKLATPNAWLVTIDVAFPAPVSSTLYLVNNTDDIVFEGRTYTAFPFDIDATKASAQGEIPQLQLRVSNVTRAMQGYIEEIEGGVGSTVLVRVLNAGHLAENYSELEMTFDVMSAVSEGQWVTFTLGAPNLLRASFPADRYLATHCRFIRHFKGAECGYAGASEICIGTLDYCRQLGNSKRFGGFPGLAGGGVRLA